MNIKKQNSYNRVICLTDCYISTKFTDDPLIKAWAEKHHAFIQFNDLWTVAYDSLPTNFSTNDLQGFAQRAFYNVYWSVYVAPDSTSEAQSDLSNIQALYDAAYEWQHTYYQSIKNRLVQAGYAAELLTAVVFEPPINVPMLHVQNNCFGELHSGIIAGAKENTEEVFIIYCSRCRKSVEDSFKRTPINLAAKDVVQDYGVNIITQNPNIANSDPFDNTTDTVGSLRYTRQCLKIAGKLLPMNIAANITGLSQKKLLTAIDEQLIRTFPDPDDEHQQLILLYEVEKLQR